MFQVYFTHFLNSDGITVDYEIKGYESRDGVVFDPGLSVIKLDCFHPNLFDLHFLQQI